MSNITKLLRLLPVVFLAMVSAGCRPTITFTALETTIVEGESTELDWDVEFSRGSGGNLVEISPDVGEVDKEGTVTVTPDETTTYVLKTQSFSMGFPMFIDEEVTVEVIEGETWDFSDTVGMDEWELFVAEYPEDDEADYQFVQNFPNTIPTIGGSGLELSADHDDAEDIDPVLMVATVRQNGLEENADYDVFVSIRYTVGARRHSSCTMPALKIKTFVSLDETDTETKDDIDGKEGIDFVVIEDQDPDTWRTLSDDITLNDEDECTVEFDSDDSVGSVSTGQSNLSITTDSDGEIYLSIVLEASFPEYEVYINSVSASFTEK